MSPILRLAVSAALVLSGSAAARAGDLSRWKTDQFPMLETCPNQGFRIAGSDTCLRLGGRLEADTTVVASPHGRAASSTRALTTGHVAGYVSMDVRTPTELGPVRAYARVRADAASPPPAVLGR